MMPHCVIEYSMPLGKRIDIKQLINCLHHAVKDSGLFEHENIKTRAIAYEHYLIGDSRKNQDFVHIRIYILKGKTSQVKKSLSQQVWQNIKSEIAFVESLTVDIREMEKELYTKKIK